MTETITKRLEVAQTVEVKIPGFVMFGDEIVYPDVQLDGDEKTEHVEYYFVAMTKTGNFGPMMAIYVTPLPGGSILLESHFGGNSCQVSECWDAHCVPATSDELARTIEGYAEIISERYDKWKQGQE